MQTVANKITLTMINNIMRFGLAMATSLLLFTAGPDGYAQALFDFTPTNTQPTSAPQSGAPASRTMSPDAFENVTKNLGQQNLNNLSQQVGQQFKQHMPAPSAPIQTPPSNNNPPLNASSPSPPSITSQPPASAPTSTKNAAGGTPPLPAPPKGAPPTSQPATANAPPPAAAPQAPSPAQVNVETNNTAPPPAAPATTAPATSTQIYTGFGAGTPNPQNSNTGNTSPNSSSNPTSGGGWNIY